MKIRNFFVLVVMLICTGCSTNTVGEKNSESIQNLGNKNYPFANSTDIFSVEQNYICQYNWNGTDRRRTDLQIKASHSTLLYVDDSWLYYKGEDEEKFTEGLYRVPLGKGEDGRTIVAGKPQQIDKDIRLASDYAVAGNYIASVSSKKLIAYNNVIENGIATTPENDTVSLYNIENKEENEKKIPDFLDQMESEGGRKDWYIVAKEEDWILWGGKALFLQMIPSNELIVLERAVTRRAAVSGEKNIVCYNIVEDVEKGIQSFWQYDIKKGKKERIIIHKKYRQVLSQGLGIPKKSLDKYDVEEIWEKDGKLYLECEVRYRVGGKKKIKKSLLLWNPAEKEQLYYDQNLNKLLHYLSDQNESLDISCFLGCIGDLWYFMNATKQRAWVYNEVTKEIKQYTDGGPEWKLIYALYPEGMLSLIH